MYSYSLDVGRYETFYSLSTEAQFIVPDWGDKVDFVTGLSYRPVRLDGLAGRYDNPLCKLSSYLYLNSKIQLLK
jgi:hypothetical protein